MRLPLPGEEGSLLVLLELAHMGVLPPEDDHKMLHLPEDDHKMLPLPEGGRRMQLHRPGEAEEDGHRRCRYSWAAGPGWNRMPGRRGLASQCGLVSRSDLACQSDLVCQSDLACQNDLVCQSDRGLASQRGPASHRDLLGLHDLHAQRARICFCLSCCWEEAGMMPSSPEGYGGAQLAPT